MFVADAGTVAMTIPIGMSLVWHVGTLAGAQQGRTNFAAFITLGTFYAAVAGGTATIMGVPHNAIALSVLQQATGRQLGFFEWMEAGVPVFVALLVAFYAVLWWLVPPETREIPNGGAFLRTERARPGPIPPGGGRGVFVFAMMGTLFTLPPFVALLLGGRHPVAALVNRALSVWVVPPAVMFLLFTIRSADHPG